MKLWKNVNDYIIKIILEYKYWQANESKSFLFEYLDSTRQ